MHSLGENRVTVSRDGTRIAFTKMGSGPSVVLVDGAFCYRENGPAPDLAPLLAQQFTVFIYDRRGRGESGDTPPYAIEREIDDLRAIVDAAGGSVDVVGVSSGAALALQAVASGGNVKKLVLYEPPYLTDGARPRSFKEPKSHLQQLVSAGDRAGAVKFFLTDVVGAPQAFVFAMPLLMPNTWKKLKLVAHTLPYDLTILSDRSVLNERSRLISVPTLVLGGKKVRRNYATRSGQWRPRFRMDVAGSSPAKITTFPGPPWPQSSLSISVRGRFALTSRKATHTYTGNRKESTLTKIALLAEVPIWSPDSNRFAR